MKLGNRLGKRRFKVYTSPTFREIDGVHKRKSRYPKLKRLIVCTICGERKYITNFSGGRINSSSPFSMRSICDDCRAKIKKKRIREGMKNGKQTRA